MEYLITQQKCVMDKLLREQFQQNYCDFFTTATDDKFTSTINSADCASIVLKDNKVYAFSFHRFVDGSSGYFHDTPKAALDKITSENKLVMTSEWLTVGSDFKNIFSKIHPAEVMINLSMVFMKNSIASAIVGQSRQDFKTDKISMRVGTVPLGVVERFGIPCTIVYCQNYNVRSNPINKVQELVSELWNNRKNDSPQFERNQTMQEIEIMEREIAKLKPLMESINWSNNNTYANWLSQAYYIAKRSTAYLGLCLFHSNKYPEFQKRCTQHIAEETGHEKLLTNDLKRIGYILLPELSETSAIYQPQYFRILENPLSFLGYVFLLELLAPAYGPYVMSQVPSDAQSFLKVHASADEDHIGEAKIMFESLNEETRKDVLDNFLMGLVSYKSMLEKIASNDRRLEVAV